MTSPGGHSSPRPRRPQTSPLDVSQTSPTSLEDAGLGILPGELPQAFSNCTDYSKHNTGRHNATREDTFKTAGSLSRRANVPGRLDKRWNLGDTKSLQEICEMGFDRSAQNLSSQVMTVMREELQQSMVTVVSAMQTEVHREGLEREAVMNGMLTQVLEQMQQLQEEARRTENLLEPLRQEITIGQQTLLQSFEERLDRFSEDVSQVRTDVARVETVMQEVETNTVSTIQEEIQKARGEEANLGLGLDDSVRRSEEKLDKVLTAQQAGTSSTTTWLQRIHEESTLHNTALDQALEQHITMLMEKQSQRDETRTEKVVHHINHTIQNVNLDIKILMNELTKIQKALHVDFAQMVDNLHDEVKTIKQGKTLDEEAFSETGEDYDFELEQAIQKELEQQTNAIKIRKRVREFWSQTDSCDVAEEWTQTDEFLMKDAQKQRKKQKQTQGFSKGLVKSDRDRQSQDAAWQKEKSNHAGMFADEEQMKARMREALIKPQYNVMDFYHQDGVFQWIARSYIFEQAVLLVIFLNAIWIWIDTDYNKEALLVNAHPVFQVAEHSFCAFFLSELIVRFMAFEGKSNCCRDAWFVFDAFLVILMVGETWIMNFVFAISGTTDSNKIGNASILRLIRLVRMLRISRMARLMRAIPELVILLKGIGAASRSVCVFFLLWFIIIYVFAVIFRNLTDDTDLKEQYFESVPDAMNTLLLEGILPDNAILVNTVAGESPVFWCVMIFFIGLAGLTVMYMLVGVLVDVVGVIAATEKEALTVSSVAQGLRMRLDHLGRDPDAPITKYEFTKLLTMPEIAIIIRDIGVDVVVLIDLVDVIYDDASVDAHGLGFPAFVDIILNMRGKNAATVKDVKDLMRAFKSLVHSQLANHLKLMRDEFAVLRTDLWELKTVIRDEDEDDDDDLGPMFEKLKSDGMPQIGGGGRRASNAQMSRMSQVNFTALVGKVKSTLQATGSPLAPPETKPPMLSIAAE